MGQLYLLIVAVMFSFGGTFAKLISPFYSSEYITFFRFVFGVLFLLILKLIKRQRFRSDFKEAFRKNWYWLVIGAAGKAFTYLTENYGLTHGVSYGNILTQPAQTLFLAFISTFVLHEKLTRKQLMFFIPCIVGVLLVSWNGRSIRDFLDGNLLLSSLYIASGIFAGFHVFAQKKVADKMDILDSNLTMFSISMLITLFPIIKPTMNGAVDGVVPDLMCLVGMIGFGLNTGIGFYLNAKAIPLVPFYMVPIIQSSMAIFAILWGVLFFHEAISIYLIIGTLMFLTGIIGLQLSSASKSKSADKPA